MMTSRTIEPAGFGPVGVPSDLDELRYQVSFGNTPNKTTYLYCPPSWNEDEYKSQKIDRRPQIAEQVKSFLGLKPVTEETKALTTTSPLFAIGTSYSSTSGSIPVLVPTIVDATLYDFTRRDTPLANGLIPRVTNYGLFADYIKRTALPSAKWKAEGAPVTSAESTYTRAAQPMKFMYATAEISGPLLITSRVWQSVLSLETEAQYRSLKELEENTIINGYPTSGDAGGTYTDANAFTGLINGITTNYTNKSGAMFTIQNLRDAIRTIREAKGHPNLIVTDYKSLDSLKALIQQELRYTNLPTGKIAWGITAVEFEGIPIIPDLFMPTASNGRECLVLDTSSLQMRVLQEPVVEELAKTSDSYKFMIKQYLTLLILRETWNYRIYGLP